ncbi:MAG: hypothetical protein JF609_01045, partial [Verrucomicrobia bacterium]|nr:hypothetical protein [Verrucomicrobiota bacterium]
MPKNNQSDPRKGFVPLVLPWLLGAVMLVIYGFTLNHWVTLINLDQVSRVSGFVWQPQLLGPLTWLATLPFHLLPAAKIPVALNFFSAVCAALSLVLLARCVAILPMDRTELQRQREKSDFGFLTGWQAYFPPVLAVLMGGLQLVLWEHATSFTGETLDLLVFAVIVWQLLEYRLDEKEWRLPLAALICGAGIAESWMFLGFLPVFLAAIIWLKKLEFFNLHFLSRMTFFALAGMLFFFLLPVVAKFNHDLKIGLWEAMRPNIRADWSLVKTIQQGDVRTRLAQASLATLLPLLLMAIRWSSGFGDSSRIGTALANNMVHVVHAAVFGACVWVMFEPPFSPHQIFLNCYYPPILGTPCLTLSFFSALSIGYCCAYFLLVFSRKPIPTRRDPRPLPVLPRSVMWICPVITATVFVCATLAVVSLLCNNQPVIKEVNNDTLSKFARFTTENLPKKGAVILCDSDIPGQDQPLRALLIKAAIAREGRTHDFPVLDTKSLDWAPYHRFMHERYPGKLPPTVGPADNGRVHPLVIFGMLCSIATSNDLCYLHPSYGYYFERFYQEPHGLAYPLKLLSDTTILPPPLDTNLIAENEIFWDKVVEALDAPVQKAIADPVPFNPKRITGWLLMHLHPVAEVNQNALITGQLCSRCLNDWGVQLQRAGELEKAARRFEQARRFNPDNIVADINLSFNQKLRTGAPLEIDLEHVNADRYGKYRNWNSVVTTCGPFDDISFCFESCFQFVQNRYFRQAAREYTRVRQLAPDNLIIRFQLAQIYLFNHLPDRALESLHDPMTTPAKF